MGFDTVKLEAASSRTSGISSQTIADGADFTGSAIDNSANLDAELNAEMVWSYGSAPTASKSVNLYLLYSKDGTNYEPIDPKNQIASFSPPTDTSTHRLMLVRGLMLLPKAFKLAAKNVDTGQTITLTVNAETFNYKVGT